MLCFCNNDVRKRSIQSLSIRTVLLSAINDTFHNEGYLLVTDKYREVFKLNYLLKNTSEHGD